MNRHKIVGAFEADKLIGYIIYDRDRLKQFGVSEGHRGRGIGSTLFNYVQRNVNKPQITLINFDETDSKSISFFHHISLKRLWQDFTVNL